jgi:hypothetical protein
VKTMFLWLLDTSLDNVRLCLTARRGVGRDWMGNSFFFFAGSFCVGV